MRGNSDMKKGKAYSEWPVGFGKVTYAPGTPKDTPRWVWKCGCDECRDLPQPQGFHGPFKTRQEAEANFIRVVQLMRCKPEGAA
jgi:hypothetical protein